jgi:CcmD family protein
MENIKFLAIAYFILWLLPAGYLIYISSKLKEIKRAIKRLEELKIN